MRSAHYGVDKAHEITASRETTLEMYRSMCQSRFFDESAGQAVLDKRVSYPVYLSLGQEAAPAALAAAAPGFMLFTQHRCHAYYLAFGGDPGRLRDELLGLPGGTSGGRAGSNCLQCHDDRLTMFGHHGLIGENVPQAVGAALGSGREVLCVVGDGAAEEDYVYPSLGFAVTHRLPVLFVCDDNDLSILTPTSTRRNWKITDLARGLGMPAVELSDDPWSVRAVAQALRGSLPALINIHSCRMNWHVGVGSDGPPEWDRFALVTERLAALGLAQEAQAIGEQEKRSMEQLWAQ